MNINVKLCYNFNTIEFALENAADFNERYEEIEDAYKKLIKLTDDNLPSEQKITKPIAVKSDEPLASEKQKDLMKKLKIPVKENMTMHEAWEAINKAKNKGE